MLGIHTTRHIRIQFLLHRTLRTLKGVTMATNLSIVMGIRAQLLMYLGQWVGKYWGIPYLGSDQLQ